MKHFSIKKKNARATNRKARNAQSNPSMHVASKWRHSDVDATSSRRIDVNAKSFQRCVPARIRPIIRSCFNFHEVLFMSHGLTVPVRSICTLPAYVYEGTASERKHAHISDNYSSCE